MSGVVMLTYAELAERRGISLLSARRLAVRNKWYKVPGNDGLTRVSVPIAALPEIERPATDPEAAVAILLGWLIHRANAAEQRAGAAEAELRDLRQSVAGELAEQRRLIELLVSRPTRSSWLWWRRRDSD